jgi:type VI secretion system secreted protein VgrG
MHHHHGHHTRRARSLDAAGTTDRGQWTQAARSIAIGVGGMTADRLLLRSMEWREELGRPFEGRVKLRSEDHAIDPVEALGQGVMIRVDGPEGATRRFTGFISRFEQTSAMRGGLAGYEATIVPWSWFMTRTADCRIFQGESAVEIVSRVMKECPRSEVASKLMRRYAPYEYKVQYRETDFDFVQRVLEHEGIYYYFSHGERSHVLTLLDSNGARLDGESDQARRLRFLPGTRSKARPDAVFEWRHAAVVKPGRFHATDYDYRHPSTSLLARAERARRHAAGDMEVFDYPGLYAEHPQGDQLVRVRMEELTSDQVTICGSTVNRFLHAGSRIMLQDHPRDDQNREHLVTAVTIVADGGAFDGDENEDPDDRAEVAVFDCRFEAIPKQTQFRPARRTNVPQIRGPQTAVVVGPAGQEIHTDALGRVKLQFHWDRYGKGDQNSSCWVRVSQPWAGAGWGGVQIPRIGQEMIVEFLEADPDRPIITGRVYNAESMPPVSAAGRSAKKGETNPRNMMEAAMQMTLRSNSLGGSGGHNEITMHDAGGAEKLYIRAQKDEVHLVQNDRKDTVRNDEDLEVGNDRSRKVGSDERVEIGVDQTTRVGRDIRISAGSSITLECGLSRITMNSAGVISISGTIVNMIGSANVNVAAPMTNVAAAAMLNLGGAVVNIAGLYTDMVGSTRLSMGGGKVSSIATDGDNIVKGTKVKIN